jgi:hypothetical protein
MNTHTHIRISFNVIIALVLVSTGYAPPINAAPLPATNTVYLPLVRTIGYEPELYAPQSLIDLQPPRPVRVTLASTAFNTHGQRLNTWQTNIKASVGAYVQMLWTHRSAPTANNTDQIYLDIVPSDATVTPRQIFSAASIPSSLPYRLRMDVYNAPCGAGFTVQAEMIEGAYVWRRTANYGCESYRELDWTAIQTTGVISP